MNKKVNPFLCRELFALVYIILQIYVGNLHRLQCLYFPAHFHVLSRDMTNSDDAPHAISWKQFRVSFHIICTDRDTCQSEICKLRMIFIRSFIQCYRNLVNDAMSSLLLDFSFDNLGFGTMHIVVTNNFLDFLQPLLDVLFIVTCTVLTKQVFEDICRHRQATFDKESKVFSYHFAYKGIYDFLL